MVLSSVLAPMFGPGGACGALPVGLMKDDRNGPKGSVVTALGENSDGATAAPGATTGAAPDGATSAPGATTGAAPDGATAAPGATTGAAPTFGDSLSDAAFETEFGAAEVRRKDGADCNDWMKGVKGVDCNDGANREDGSTEVDESDGGNDCENDDGT